MTKQLTIGEAAELLGLEVDSVRKLERAGKIRHIKVTGQPSVMPRNEVKCVRAILAQDDA